MGELPLEQEIRRQLVDGAAHLLGAQQEVCRTKPGLWRSPRCRRDGNRPIMAFRTVSPHIATVCVGSSGAIGQLSADLRMARQVDEDAGNAACVEIHRDCVLVPDLLDVVRLVSTWKPAKPKISNRA